MKWRESLSGFGHLGRKGVEWRWLCWLWSRVYRRWLWNDFHKDYDRVTAVKGWRSARILTTSGRVAGITPCFWGLD